MNRKLILKFDEKSSQLRCDMYKAESLRLDGRCMVTLVSDMSPGAIHHKLNELIMQLDGTFNIGFKKNNLKSIKAWIVANIFKVYIRKDMADNLDAAILKLISDKCIIIRD